MLKKQPVEAEISEFIAEQGLRAATTPELKKAVDLTLIAFYYLLLIREYTIKGTCNKTKQIVQFKYEDITFFKKKAVGLLQCLPCSAPDSLICMAYGATLKLNNQKKRGKRGVCTRIERGHTQLPCLGFGMPISSPQMPQYKKLNLHIRILARGQEMRCDCRRHQQSTKNFCDHAAIPYKQRDAHQQTLHTLLAEWRSQRPRLSWLLGHTDTENGTLVRGNIQRIHPRGASMLRYQNVKGYETKIQFCQYCRKCPSGHHEQDAQCNRPIGKTIQT
jgi:hypothetical protein